MLEWCFSLVPVPPCSTSGVSSGEETEEESNGHGACQTLCLLSCHGNGNLVFQTSITADVRQDAPSTLDVTRALARLVQESYASARSEFGLSHATCSPSPTAPTMGAAIVTLLTAGAIVCLVAQQESAPTTEAPEGYHRIGAWMDYPRWTVRIARPWSNKWLFKSCAARHDDHVMNAVSHHSSLWYYELQVYNLHIPPLLNTFQPDMGEPWVRLDDGSSPFSFCVQARKCEGHHRDRVVVYVNGAFTLEEAIPNQSTAGHSVPGLHVEVRCTHRMHSEMNGAIFPTFVAARAMEDFLCGEDVEDLACFRAWMNTKVGAQLLKSAEPHREAPFLLSNRPDLLDDGVLPPMARSWIASETALWSISRHNAPLTEFVRQAAASLYGSVELGAPDCATSLEPVEAVKAVEAVKVYQIPLDRATMLTLCGGRGSLASHHGEHRLYVTQDATPEQMFDAWHRHFGYQGVHRFPALQRAAADADRIEREEELAETMEAAEAEAVVCTAMPDGFSSDTRMEKARALQCSSDSIVQAYAIECDADRYMLVRDATCPALEARGAISLSELQALSIPTQIDESARGELERTMPCLHKRLRMATQGMETAAQAIESCILELEAHRLQNTAWDLKDIDEGGGTDSLGLSLLFAFLFGRWLGARVRIYVDENHAALGGVWNGAHFVPVDVTRPRHTIFSLAPKLLPFAESGSVLKVRPGMVIDVLRNQKWHAGVVAQYVEKNKLIRVRDLNTLQVSYVSVDSQWRRTCQSENSNLDSVVNSLLKSSRT